MTNGKSFAQQVLELFTEAVRTTLHPSLYERMLRDIGSSLGREVIRQVRQSNTVSRAFTREDYLRCGEWMKAHWGWEHDIRIDSPDEIRIHAPTCPFNKLAAEDSLICQVEAAIFGSIAGDQFGYGKVVVERGLGAPPRNCHLTVYLERTPHNVTQEGPTFVAGRNGDKREKDTDADKRILAQLTQRERQIIKLIAEGLSDKQIAGALHLSVRTIEGHVARIRDKTALRSRSALIRFALRSSTI